MQTQIEQYDGEQSETETPTRDRAAGVESTIHDRIERSYVPGQGSALDRVSAIRRKAEAFPIENWSTELIELHLYDLGQLAGNMEVRGDLPSTNCKAFARKAEALHQDLIAELQARDRFTREEREYLASQFEGVCSLVEYANTPGYTGEDCYFEGVREIVSVADRFEEVRDE